MSIWKISQDGLSASRTLDNGGMESRLISAIEPEELANALPADPIDLTPEVRAKRDALLSASDWTQMPDSPLTAAKKTLWKTYRQELRDLTSNPAFPDVVFPTQPI